MTNAKNALTQMFGYQVRTGYEIQSGADTCAPTLIWADSDYEVGDGLCGLHPDQKGANEPSIPYVRFDTVLQLTAENDRLKARVAELEDALSNVMGHVDTPIGRRRLLLVGRRPEWLTTARAALKNKDASND
ncbi:hypothetical protein GCM10016455_05920 [Aliiroseovarius zhejiangensis]|uniref:Uncharacterized protein n=1 Tax=Aliiroseovarius zhejiangensis TaxID=1632025 RepID=A0ABQ3IRE9_9RHOB|nr:hypothetical protein [Aliiroseovarius zhejiangensis]GHE88602.1 hypothetical protein GCM10016455_05920 [Aliiroseovarius zhejiangensis]